MALRGPQSQIICNKLGAYDLYVPTWGGGLEIEVTVNDSVGNSSSSIGNNSILNSILVNTKWYYFFMCINSNLLSA